MAAFVQGMARRVRSRVSGARDAESLLRSGCSQLLLTRDQGSQRFDRLWRGQARLGTDGSVRQANRAVQVACSPSDKALCPLWMAHKISGTCNQSLEQSCMPLLQNNFA